MPGATELFAWFARPVTRAERPRDELAVKLALAVTRGGGRRAGDRARSAQARAGARCRTTHGSRHGWTPRSWPPSLVLESMIFQCEAEIRWLDQSRRGCCGMRARAADRSGCGAGRQEPPQEDTGAPARSRRNSTTNGHSHRTAGHQGGEHHMSGKPRSSELRGVTRIHGKGAAEVHALRGVDLVVARRGAGGGHGPVGLGQVHAAVAGRRPGLADRRRGLIEDTPLASQSKAQLAAIRRRSVGYVFQDYNLIPALTAAENVALPRELDGVAARKARAGGDGRAGGGGPARRGRPLPRRDVRRPAAAGRDRPGAHRRAPPDPHRRADRRPGHRDRRGGAAAAAQALRRGRRRRPGHPRGPARRLGRPHRLHPRRPHRRRIRTLTAC